MQGEPQTSPRALPLTTGGITPLSVLPGIGVTVAFGIQASWW